MEDVKTLVTDFKKRVKERKLAIATLNEALQTRGADICSLCQQIIWHAQILQSDQAALNSYKTGAVDEGEILARSARRRRKTR